MSVLLDMHEIADLAGSLATAAKTVRPLVSKDLVATSEAIGKTASDNAPRSPWSVPVHLADTIEVTGPQGGALRPGVSMVGEIGPTAFWGGWVENGTAQRGPDPYLEPALDRHVEGFAIRVAAIGAAVIR